MKKFLYFFLSISYVVNINAQNNVCCKVLDSLKLNNDNCCCENDTTYLCPIKDGKKIIPKTVIYDFKTGVIVYPSGTSKIGRGDAIRIKIVNFNRFLYQATINAKDTVHAAAIDNTNLFGSFSNISNLSSLVSNLAGTITTAGANIQNTASDFVNISRSFYSKMNQQKDTAKKDNKNGKSVMEVQRLLELKKRNDDLAEIFASNTKIIRTKDKDFHALKDEIDSLTNFGWSRLSKVLREPYPSCGEFKLITNTSIIDTISSGFIVLKNQIRSSLDNIKENRYKYLDAAAGYIDLIRAKDSVNFYVADSLIKSYYTQSMGYLNTLDSILSYKALQTITEPFDKMKDAKPCYNTEPLFLSGDSKMVNLIIKPWSDSARLTQGQTISFELPWTQRHIWGVTGGIYVGTLYNNNYTNRFDSISPTNKSYKLVSDNTSGGFEFGVNVLAYSDWKLNNNNDKNYWYGGIAFGAGTTIESKPKPRFFLGVNLANGMNNKLLITFGLSGGFVNRLSEAYSESASYVNEQSGYLKDVFKAGAFLSISYSFLNK